MKVQEAGQQLKIFAEAASPPSWQVIRKVNINKKHEAIKKAFKELYDGERLRYDDVVERLSSNFFLSKISIEKILRK